MDCIVWVWAAAGLLMILAELIIPGFVIIFFGIAAVLVALLRSIFEVPVMLQLLLFAVFGVLLLLLCRKHFPAIFQGKSKEDESDIDEDAVAGATAVVVEAIEPPRAGKVDFRGSYWEASADCPVAVGSVVRVVHRDNLTLIVKSAEMSPKNNEED